MHNNEELNPMTGKPVIIHHYNETKSGVDTLDQLQDDGQCVSFTKYSTSPALTVKLYITITVRKTIHWKVKIGENF